MRRPESLAIAQRLAVHAAARGVPMVRFAVAWVMAHRQVSSVIGGPRTLAQWQDYFDAETLGWTDAGEQAVDDLVMPGGSSSPGFQDPYYPVPARR